jgi:hypothetical protein
MAQGGTNLAKETGGNLATIVTSTGVMDDWDESDRAKVNLIVGQAGIAAGAGAVGATVPRVTLGSDDPAVTALAAIQTAVQILDNIVSGSEAQVDIVSSALPTGASTLAEQQTQTTHLTTVIGHVDGIEAALTDVVTSAQIMDDWDETNRCKVNLIVGQAGISAGAGAVDATTPRVTHASDDPVVVAIQILDNIVSGNEAQVDIVSGTLTTVTTVTTVSTVSSITAGFVTPAASATGTGTTGYRHVSLSNTDNAVKASAGRLYAIHAYNPNANVVYLHFYDASTASVTTSTTPTRTYIIPPNGWLDQVFTVPQTYATAITVAASDTSADASDAPGSNLIIQLEYI